MLPFIVRYCYQLLQSLHVTYFISIAHLHYCVVSYISTSSPVRIKRVESQKALLPQRPRRDELVRHGHGLLLHRLMWRRAVLGINIPQQRLHLDKSQTRHLQLTHHVQCQTCRKKEKLELTASRHSPVLRWKRQTGSVFGLHLPRAPSSAQDRKHLRRGISRC